MSGGASYSRGSLYELLQNPLYIGETRHKKQSFPGEHEAILDRELWEKVGAKLKENAVARRHGTNASAPSLLRGLLFDEQGNRFTPSHAVKNGKRYRYYVSQKVIKQGASASNGPSRIPAREIEQLVLDKLKGFFGSADEVVSALALDEDDVATTRALVEAAHRYSGSLDEHAAASLNQMLAKLVFRMIISEQSVEVQLHKHRVRSQLLDAPNAEYQAENLGDIDEDVVALTVPANLRRCGEEGTRLIIPAGTRPASKTVPPLLKAVCRAHEWVRLIETGKYKDQRAIASATGLNERYISHILPSAFLAPEMIEAIVQGCQEPAWSLEDLRNDMPLSWARQRHSSSL